MFKVWKIGLKHLPEAICYIKYAADAQKIDSRSAWLVHAREQHTIALLLNSTRYIRYIQCNFSQSGNRSFASDDTRATMARTAHFIGSASLIFYLILPSENCKSSSAARATDNSILSRFLAFHAISKIVTLKVNCLRNSALVMYTLEHRCIRLQLEMSMSSIALILAKYRGKTRRACVYELFHPLHRGTARSRACVSCRGHRHQLQRRRIGEKENPHHILYLVVSDDYNDDDDDSPDRLRTSVQQHNLYTWPREWHFLLVGAPHGRDRSRASVKKEASKGKRKQRLFRRISGALQNAVLLIASSSSQLRKVRDKEYNEFGRYDIRQIGAELNFYVWNDLVRHSPYYSELELFEKNHVSQSVVNLPRVEKRCNSQYVNRWHINAKIILERERAFHYLYTLEFCARDCLRYSFFFAHCVSVIFFDKNCRFTRADADENCPIQVKLAVARPRALRASDRDIAEKRDRELLPRLAYIYIHTTHNTHVYLCLYWLLPSYKLVARAFLYVCVAEKVKRDWRISYVQCVAYIYNIKYLQHTAAAAATAARARSVMCTIDDCTARDSLERYVSSFWLTQALVKIADATRNADQKIIITRNNAAHAKGVKKRASVHRCSARSFLTLSRGRSGPCVRTRTQYQCFEPSRQRLPARARAVTKYLRRRATAFFFFMSRSYAILSRARDVQACASVRMYMRAPRFELIMSMFDDRIARLSVQLLDLRKPNCVDGSNLLCSSHQIKRLWKSLSQIFKRDCAKEIGRNLPELPLGEARAKRNVTAARECDRRASCNVFRSTSNIIRSTHALTVRFFDLYSATLIDRSHFQFKIQQLKIRTVANEDLISLLSTNFKRNFTPRISRYMKNSTFCASKDVPG
ncbi:unnamed protein product [Trichogramma brassicae]|uniref:Uncharacterized protein n=1 Tax=Trichogramma brassicae TaxID=86971 RepID=A0A6H5IUH4_9HYME|nr:unnamed protein product [Trichogramma brassicae]